MRTRRVKKRFLINAAGFSSGGVVFSSLCARDLCARDLSPSLIFLGIGA
jgi:hypothetical protein